MDLNPLSQIDPFVIAGTIVIVFLTFVALRRVFVLPYLEVMEERQRLFDRSDAEVADAEQARSLAEADAEQALADARDEAERILGVARQAAETYRGERLDEANRQAAERLVEGRAEIARAKESELALLREQALECVGLACDRLLVSGDPAAVEAAVDRVLARRIH